MLAEPSQVHVTTLSQGLGLASARQLAADTRAALARSEFTLSYQPRLALSTGAIRGYSTTVHCPNQDLDLAAPDDAGPGEAVGGWAIGQACRDARRWGGVRVSVPVSARQLRSPLLPGQVEAALSWTGLAADRLELEVAEMLLLGNDTETLLALSALRDTGIGLSLSAFGAGLGSLFMLKRLPLTTLKLDRSLVRDLPEDTENAAIVRAVVQTAHVLGIVVAADGIETEAQRAYLASLGCDEGQGELFGNPAFCELTGPVLAKQDVTCPVARSTPETRDERALSRSTTH